MAVPAVAGGIAEFNGDMTPLTRAAKNLAALEAIFGQLYLAVLIARLVGQAQLNKNRDD